MEKLFEIYNKNSYNKIYSEGDAINMVTVKNNFVLHKQIEQKNGRIFMRMKKRDLMACS